MDKQEVFRFEDESCIGSTVGGHSGNICRTNLTRIKSLFPCFEDKIIKETLEHRLINSGSEGRTTSAMWHVIRSSRGEASWAAQPMSGPQWWLFTWWPKGRLFVLFSPNSINSVRNLKCDTVQVSKPCLCCFYGKHSIIIFIDVFCFLFFCRTEIQRKSKCGKAMKMVVVVVWEITESKSIPWFSACRSHSLIILNTSVWGLSTWYM